MFGGVFGNFYWGISMLLHMLIPIIVIILAMTHARFVGHTGVR